MSRHARTGIQGENRLRTCWCLSASRHVRTDLRLGDLPCVVRSGHETQVLPVSLLSLSFLRRRSGDQATEVLQTRHLDTGELTTEVQATRHMATGELATEVLSARDKATEVLATEVR